MPPHLGHRARRAASRYIGAVLGPVVAGVAVDRARTPVAALWCAAGAAAVAAAIVLVDRARRGPVADAVGAVAR
ncbi:hypothetical protein [Nocardia sp. NPDC055049]